MALLGAAVVATALLVCLRATSVTAQDEGKPCTHTRLGVPGTCRFLKSCPQAVAELMQENRVNPQICGFRPSTLTPNVCCPNGPNNRPSPGEGSNPVMEREQTTVGAIARRKCQEYSQSAQQNGHCHVKKTGGPTIQKLIVNGVPALPKEFPHMALLGYGVGKDLEYSCAGSLISDTWVLTAAHCLSHPSKGMVTAVLMGDLDRSTDEDDDRPQQVAVVETVRHPDFQPRLRYHDIALLRLARPATLSEYVRPACLHTGARAPDDLPLGVGDNVTVSGWGVTDFAEEQLSPVLLKARLSVSSQAACNESFASASRIPGSRLPNGIRDTQLCAGSTSGKDACQGDSGGPLQVFTLQSPYCMQHVVGVVSLGIFCGSKAPGVYTRVSAYTAWIERTVWPSGPSGPSGASRPTRPSPASWQ